MDIALPDGQLHVDGDYLFTQQALSGMRISGNGVVRARGVEVRADGIELDESGMKIEFSGNVRAVFKVPKGTRSDEEGQ